MGNAQIIDQLHSDTLISDIIFSDTNIRNDYFNFFLFFYSFRTKLYAV